MFTELKYNLNQNGHLIIVITLVDYIVYLERGTTSAVNHNIVSIT